MLREPYLIVGFDVDPANPQASTIIADVERDFPFVPVLPLGVENLYALEVPLSQLTPRFRQVTTYLAGKDQIHQNLLRWVVQICRSSEVSHG